MKIFIGSDHAGFELKKHLVKYLDDMGHDVRDMGPKEYKPQDDYPDFIVPVAKEVSHEPRHLRGIVIGGTGVGEAIAANKVYGVRAALYYGGNMDVVKLSREHNDANVLSLGARFIHNRDAERAVKLWLETPFSEDERHKRRLAKIYKING